MARLQDSLRGEVIREMSPPSRSETPPAAGGTENITKKPQPQSTPPTPTSPPAAAPTPSAPASAAVPASTPPTPPTLGAALAGGIPASAPVSAPTERPKVDLNRLEESTPISEIIQKLRDFKRPSVTSGGLSADMGSKNG